MITLFALFIGVFDGFEKDFRKTAIITCGVVESVFWICTALTLIFSGRAIL